MDVGSQDAGRKVSIEIVDFVRYPVLHFPEVEWIPVDIPPTSDDFTALEWATNVLKRRNIGLIELVIPVTIMSSAIPSLMEVVFESLEVTRLFAKVLCVINGLKKKNIGIIVILLQEVDLILAGCFRDTTLAVEIPRHCGDFFGHWSCSSSVIV